MKITATLAKNPLTWSRNLRFLRSIANFGYGGAEVGVMYREAADGVDVAFIHNGELVIRFVPHIKGKSSRAVAIDEFETYTKNN